MKNSRDIDIQREGPGCYLITTTTKVWHVVKNPCGWVAYTTNEMGQEDDVLDPYNTLREVKAVLSRDCYNPIPRDTICEKCYRPIITHYSDDLCGDCIDKFSPQVPSKKQMLQLKKDKEPIEIYTDPLTEKELEGKAVLIDYVRDMGVYNGHDVERWRVKFVSDGFVADRTILV